QLTARGEPTTTGPRAPMGLGRRPAVPALELERLRLLQRIHVSVGLAEVLLVHPAVDPARDVVVDLRDPVPLREPVLVHRRPRLLRVVPQVLADLVRLLAHRTHALPNI